jgi:hypothetical protein
MNDLDDPHSATNLLVGKGYIEGALARWTLGDRIWGHKSRSQFLKRLDPPPPEVWEVRVTEPVVMARLFGRFAEQDTLILTKFHTRGALGNKGSTHWHAAMGQCDATWNRLFPGLAPHTGTAIHHYVSENCDDFPI